MQLTILGSSAAYPGPGRACSGYLIRQGRTSILVDLGSGVLASLQQHQRLDEIDGVLISHLHADHFLDIYLLQVFLQFDAPHKAPLPLYGPPGADERINSLQPSAAERFRQLFDFRPWSDGGETVIGDLKVKTVLTEHAEKTFAMRFEGGGPASIVYTADTGPSLAVESLAKDCDLLMAECSWLDRPADAAVGHLATADAASMARSAGAKRLVLTHLWPTMDEQAALQRARESYGGPVDLAVQGTTFNLD